FLTDSPHILEGKFGYWSNQLLKAQIGSTGIAALLVFAYLTVLILIYNLDLKWSWFPKKNEEESEDDEEDNFDSFNSPINPSVVASRNTLHQQEDLEEDTPIREENPLPLQQNSIREQHTASVDTTVDLQNESSPEKESEITFTVDTPTEIDIPEQQKANPAPEEPALSVEKVVEEKAITSDDLVAQFGEYDPKLDLSGYQYPTLDLLTDYGTGKITINQQELEANKNRIVETLRNYSIEIEHIKATIGP